MYSDTTAFAPAAARSGSLDLKKIVTTCDFSDGRTVSAFWTERILSSSEEASKPKCLRLPNSFKRGEVGDLGPMLVDRAVSSLAATRFANDSLSNTLISF